MKLEAETQDEEQDEILIEEDDNDDNNGDNAEEKMDGHISTSAMSYRKLATIVGVLAILLGLVISTYQNIQIGKPKVIYANRYSKEHKFRPAASPVVTETLRDGRVRIRGAEATMSSPPRPTTTAQRTRKKSKQRASRRKTNEY